MKIHLHTLIFLIITSFSYAQQAPVYVGPRGSTADDPANGIYVSPDGNDITATGSIDNPYKSINTALSKASSGSTIILRGGSYYEGINVRVREPNITIKSKKGEWAIIDLTDYNPGHHDDSGVYFYPGSSGSKLQAVEVIGGYYAVCIETEWDWLPPQTPPVHGPGVCNIIIEDCILHDSKNDVVKVKPDCNNITIRYCEIYNSGQEFSGDDCTPDGRANAEAIDNVNGDNMVVQNNYIHDICTNGIYAKGGAGDAVIENNIIENIKGAGILIGFDTSPDFFDLNVNPEYYENFRGIVRNNLIINTVLSGIGLYAAKDAQVYNNTLVNVCTHATYHSAIYFGVATQDYDNYDGCPPSINPNIHNNIICQPSSNTGKMIEIRYIENFHFYPSDLYRDLSALNGKPMMSENCYYIAGKSASFTDRRPGGINYAGLAAWKSHIDGDTGSVEVNPDLDVDYIPANAQCTGMGIQHPLKINTTGIIAPILVLETSAYISNGILYLKNSIAEKVQVYSINGTLLYNLLKSNGETNYSINQPKGTELIIKGSTGWRKKVIVQ